MGFFVANDIGLPPKWESSPGRGENKKYFKPPQNCVSVSHSWDPNTKNIRLSSKSTEINQTKWGPPAPKVMTHAVIKRLFSR